MKESACGSQKRPEFRFAGDRIFYQSQMFKLGKSQRGTSVPLNGPNKIKAMRLRLEEIGL